MDSVQIQNFALAMAMDEKSKETLQRAISQKKDIESNKDNETVINDDLSKLNNPVISTFGLQ